jgi:two-component system, OmpR family, sensor histidine kinase KdpD
MRRALSIEWRHLALTVAATAAALAVTTVLVAVIEQNAGVSNASAVYLLAVVLAAVAFGTLAATGASIAAFLLYTYFFTEPLYTFSVVDPGEWVTVVLLLVIGTVVGQLAAGQRNRAEAAEHREREARALVEVSRVLAMRDQTSSAASEIATILCREGRMERVWIVLITEAGGERALADSEPDAPPLRASTYQALQRVPGPGTPRWTRIRNPVARDDRVLTGRQVFRVAIEAGGRTLGALWALRERDAGLPRTEETRMLAAAADQIGQAIEQDRLRADATSAELARRSDALKSALLDSVSHDLRTPLASIRAAAGSLMDRSVGWSPDDEAAIVTTIDREAERLNRLVTNLLDVSRIEAGGLRGEFEPYTLDDIVATAVARLRPSLGGRTLTIDIPPDTPPVSVDAMFIDQAVTNVVENAIKYVPEGAQIRFSAAIVDPTRVRLIVEDGGPGVPQGSFTRLFDKFYRVPRPGEGSRKGTGIGLTVVRGLVETMGGTVSAGPSELGGLAIAIELPVAQAPAPAESSATESPAATEPPSGVGAA